jgi:hypothetical protein
MINNYIHTWFLLQAHTCCICYKQLSNDNRNIFDGKLLINSQEKDTCEKSDGYMTLRDAIELITGFTVSIL